MAPVPALGRFLGKLAVVVLERGIEQTVVI